MTTQASAAYALDAGGSHTVVRTRRADGSERTWDEPSCAIATVGQGRAIQHLRRILGEVRAELADAGAMRGCIASSSCPVAAEAPAPEPLVRAIAASGCTGRVVLVNDLVPLLWSDLLPGGAACRVSARARQLPRCGIVRRGDGRQPEVPGACHGRFGPGWALPADCGAQQH